jgi:hypothetical protein
MIVVTEMGIQVSYEDINDTTFRMEYDIRY